MNRHAASESSSSAPSSAMPDTLLVVPANAADVNKLIAHYATISANAQVVETVVKLTSGMSMIRRDAKWTKVIEMITNTLKTKQPEGTHAFSFARLCISLLHRSYLPGIPQADAWNKLCVTAATTLLASDWSIASVTDVIKTVVPTKDSLHCTIASGINQMKIDVLPSSCTGEDLNTHLQVYLNLVLFDAASEEDDGLVGDFELSPESIDKFGKKLRDECKRSLVVLLSSLAAIEPPCAQTASVLELLETNFTKKHAAIAREWYKTIKPWAELVVDLHNELELLLMACEAVARGQDTFMPGADPETVISVKACLATVHRVPSARLCFVAGCIQKELPSALNRLPLEQRMRDTIGTMDDLTFSRVADQASSSIRGNPRCLVDLKRTVDLLGLLRTANKASIRYAQWVKSGRATMLAAVDTEGATQSMLIQRTMSMLQSPASALPMLRTFRVMGVNNDMLAGLDEMLVDDYEFYMSDEDSADTGAPVIHDLQWLRLTFEKTQNQTSSGAAAFDEYEYGGRGSVGF